jgi:hypothetical protein
MAWIMKKAEEESGLTLLKSSKLLLKEMLYAEYEVDLD